MKQESIHHLHDRLTRMEISRLFDRPKKKVVHMGICTRNTATTINYKSQDINTIIQALTMYECNE